MPGGDGPAGRPPSRRRLTRALRHRNFRLFFGGQGLSVVGTWLTRFAMAYEAFALTHSAFYVGLVAFASRAPAALVAPFAGVLVDRWNRHRMVLATQTLAMGQAAALAAFALTGTLTIWHLVALAGIQALIKGVDAPTRQAFLRQMIDDPADLPNAIALNSSLVNAARLVGPLLAALLVGLVGVGVCFATDAVSYLAVIAAFLAMRLAPRPLPPRGGRVLAEMRAGLAYVRGMPLVTGVLLMVGAASLAAGAYAEMLPTIAQGALHGGPHALGVLMAAGGLGALTGLLYLARRESVLGLGRFIAWCGIGLGTSLIALEAARTVWLAVPALFGIGGCLMTTWAAGNTLVQTVAHDEKLGRVMSLYVLVFVTAAPLGALGQGALATVIGPIHTFALAGVFVLICALAFRRALPRLRRASHARYVELGILDDRA